MYHGVTTTGYTPAIWTQLPLATFRQQLLFLKKQYAPVSLHEVIEAIRGGTPLPEQAVLITFDDGLKNNYSVAFPVLHELNVPAAIFLTVDLIGTDEILWFDELYFLLQESIVQGINPDLPDATARIMVQNRQLWEAYLIIVETMKRAGLERRVQQMASLRAAVPLDRQKLIPDFGLLNWSQIDAMQRTGLVEFGVHTATHRILTGLTDEEWAEEIVIPKQTLEKELNAEAAAFCFPNGKPLIDFRPDQPGSLRKAGYECAFTTENALFNWAGGDTMAISRVPAGNDATSDPSYFKLNASGALHFIRNLINGPQASCRLHGAKP